MPSDFILRIEGQTFADESFKTVDPHGLVVLAEVPIWSELRWHAEMVRQCGADLKWRKVDSRWDRLGDVLRSAVLRDLRDALISIVDPSVYRLDFERTIANAVRRPKRMWSPKFSEWVEAKLIEYERLGILEDSPALRIQGFLEDDGVMLGGVGGIDGNFDENRSVLGDLAETLKAPHSVRLFGARSAAAFSPLLDRAAWDQALDELWDVRYVSSQRLVGHMLAAGERTQRVFDEGNRPSVRAIADLKDAVRSRMAMSGLIYLPDDLPAGAVEQSSTITPQLQAADLAAGYARTLYVTKGLKTVCEEFRSVILNGSMVRDWSQVDRSDLSELRSKR